MPQPATKLLENAGHDIYDVSQRNSSESDVNLLSLATAEQRLLITEDKDFGTLIQRDRVPAPYGVLLFRIGETIDMEIACRLIYQITSAQEQWPAGIWSFRIGYRP